MGRLWGDMKLCGRHPFYLLLHKSRSAEGVEVRCYVNLLFYDLYTGRLMFFKAVFVAMSTADCLETNDQRRARGVMTVAKLFSAECRSTNDQIS